MADVGYSGFALCGQSVAPGVETILAVLALLAVIRRAEAGPSGASTGGETWRLRALVAAYSALLTSLVLLLTGRLLVATVVTLAVVTTLWLISKTKYRYLKSRLVFHDFYFHLTGHAELEFLLDQYRHLARGALVVLVLVVAILALAWREDRCHVPRLAGLGLVAITALLSEVAARQHRDKLKDVFWRGAFDEAHLSSFILSMRTFARWTGRPLALPTISKALPAAAAPLGNCSEDPGAADRPHIIVILHESSVDPSLYFTGDRFKGADSLFASGDGKSRRMRVHTYGGRTWITEYGFLLGIDMSYFEEFSSFLGFVGVGRFANTLPQELNRLGYRTIANYPSPPSFLNTGIFFPSIGFQHLYKPEDMQLFIRATDRPRDREYYEFVMDDLARAQAGGDSGAAFYFLWTTATHAPYHFPMFPSERADEIAVGDERLEFARRQRIAADDLAWFEATLRARFPSDKFLVAGFGDHHPYVTRDYFEKGSSDRRGLQPFDPSEFQNKTYFRISGVNFAPAYRDLPDFADVGFLGEILLEAARLPASSSFLEKRKLRRHSGGEWAECPDQDAVLRVNAILSSGAASIFAATQ